MKMLILSRKLVFCSMIVRIFSGTVPFKPWGFSQTAVLPLLSMSSAMKSCALTPEKNVQIY